MPTTPLQALPYPALSDAANGPVAFQNLAQAVEQKLVQVYDDAADRAGKVTAPTAGMLTYLTGPGRFELYNGSFWFTLGASGGPVPVGVLNQTVAQAFPNGAGTFVSFNEVLADVGGMADMANNRLIAPVSGTYCVHGQLPLLLGTAGNTYRRAQIRVNNIDVQANALDGVGTGGLPTVVPVAWVGPVNAGEAITMMGFHTGGITLNSSVGLYHASLSAYLVQAN